MVQIQKLYGVVLVDKVIHQCPTCTQIVVPRKIEVLYHSQNNKTISAYLLTDVWFCSRCSVGFMLSTFQSTTDPFNKRWTVKHQEQKVPVNKVENKQEKVPPSLAINKKNVAVPSSIQRIYKVIADHISQCTSCSSLLIKQSVRLLMKMTDNRSSRELQTTSMYCPACRKWMLHESVYVLLQQQNKSYLIEVELQPKKVPQVKQSTGTYQQARSKQQKKAHKQVATTKQEPNKSGKLYDRYGVFVPSKSSKNRRGYFDE
ncbi:hypothetical protein [Paenibacillus anseongense]|uniref:hypothetical protein n=1 Tax=Paenibacillus anseongense TaxID=2682845 RepID=UPI002DBF4D4D|nr:hypothetical protein [Paenibacillus anseongense]MEC0269721.1 hypothetical protein [Paenibacillus anseongense]